MDSLVLVVELVKALAWPVTAVVLALLFRDQVAMLLRNIKRGKIGSAEFEFEREMQAIEARVPDLPSLPPPASAAKDATANPRGTVLEAWLKLEDKVIDLAMERGLTNATARRYAPASLQAVRKSGLLPEAHLSLLSELQELRNRAAHDPDFSPDPDAVLSYVRLAADLEHQLNQISGTKA
ncbi:hypothetical protein [Halopseudomonas xiamenensis]|uniref:hypothetical protein n=1 Tax=Halopseudomonas xiamenensis TaxID=157792 RepID=UPI0016296D74|nr:hypothetical protein [Halopseudomonas xiamenensis]